MIYRIALIPTILFALCAAACVQPVVTNTPPAATPSATQSPTPAPTDTPILMATPSATETVTPTFTPSATATATLTPTITNTLAPTGTADQVNMFFPPSITVTFDPDNPMQHCFLTFYDATLMPGFLGVWRRDKGGYFDCVAKEQ